MTGWMPPSAAVYALADREYRAATPPPGLWEQHPDAMKGSPMPHTDPLTGALITDHEIGQLPPLLPHEHLAVTTGLAQAARGEEITPSVATQCVHALARLAGLEDTLPAQGVMPERPAEQLDTPTLTPQASVQRVETAFGLRGMHPDRVIVDEPITADDLDDKSSRGRHAADEPPHCSSANPTTGAACVLGEGHGDQHSSWLGNRWDEPPLQLPVVLNNGESIELPPIDSPPTDPLLWRDGGGIY